MRIVLVDDHALFRDGIASLLRVWDHEVVGQAANGRDALAVIDEVGPELVLLDVAMPELGGAETARRIKERHPDTAVVMLTASEDEDDLFSSIEAGAQGYLLKDLEGAQFRAMLEVVQRGEAAISPATAAHVLKRFVRGGPKASVSTGVLTEREVEVLRLVTGGLRNKEIALRLRISENTAKYHLKRILQKLHAQSRAELAGRAGKEGLLKER